MFTGCTDQTSSVDRHMEKGRAFLEAGKYSKAHIEFKNVLQIDQKHAEAYVLLGKSEEGNKNWRRALISYSEATRLAPKNIEAHARLGRMYQISGDINAATRQMEIILSIDNENYDGLMLKAVLFAQRKKNKEAIGVVSNILLVHPDKREAIALLANIYTWQNNLNKAVDVLSTGLSYKKDNIQLLLQLAQVYVAALKMDEAENILSRVILIEPENMQHRVNLSTFYVKRNRVEEAENVLRQAIKEKPDDENRYLLLVSFLVANKSSLIAEAELINFINSMPESTKLRSALVDLYDRNSKTEQAINEHKEIIRRGILTPDAMKSRKSLAALLLRERRQAEAHIYIDEVLNENPDDYDALLLKGKLALSVHDLPAAITLFRRVLKDQPDSFKVVNILAASHMRNNEPAMAKKVMQRFLDLIPKNITAMLTLAKYMIQDADYDAALDQLNRALVISKSNILALQLKVSALAGKQDNKAALELLAQIQKLYPDNVENYKLFGDLYFKLGKYSLAIGAYENALKKSGKQLPYMASITKVYLKQNKPDKAIDRINQQFSASSDLAVLHELLAEVYIYAKQYDKAEASLDIAIKLKPGWNLLYTTLAKLQFNQGNKPAAVNTYTLGLKMIPDDERLSTELADIYESHYEYDKAIALYEAVLINNHSNLLAANNLASILVNHKENQVDLKRAKELAARFEASKNPVYLDTLGWVLYKTGNMKKAIELLNKAVKAAPTVPHFNYHLGMAYHALRDPLARKYLAAALESNLKFPGRREAEMVMQRLN